MFFENVLKLKKNNDRFWKFKIYEINFNFWSIEFPTKQMYFVLKGR